MKERMIAGHSFSERAVRHGKESVSMENSDLAIMFCSVITGPSNNFALLLWVVDREQNRIAFV